MKDYRSLQEIQADLASQQVTCIALTQHYLAEIKAKQHLNAFLEVFEEEALHQAAYIDSKIKEGTSGKLAGMVIGLKDNICFKGHRVSASSKILENFTSIYSSTVVEKLMAEDAIIIGRLNCDEFAMGSSNENSAFGRVKNPLDETTVPGGSSGGSAAAVAAGLCLAALGSDTGGSIRQPASFTGTVGLKPTYGRVSRYGLIAYASSFDQIGPITHQVSDAALILEVIAGKDPKDATSSSLHVANYSSEIEQDSNKKYKIAYIKDCIEHPGLDTEIKEYFATLFETLKADGHQVEAVEFPYLDYMVPAYYVLTTAEASSNLSRFGGVLYGYRSPNATDIETTYKKSRTEGFGSEVKRRIMLGTFVLSAGYYDAYYAKGQKVRRLLQNKTNEILDKADFVILPTTPKTAFKAGEIKDPITMYLEDIYTVQANLTGVPAISLPLAKTASGMPFGTQIMTQQFKELELLRFAKQLENNLSK